MENNRKKDVFITKNGKKITITAIKHASLEIEYEGLHIETDPVTDGAKPVTDYKQFDKADIILVTHNHYDHLDKQAIEDLSKPTTKIYSNSLVKEVIPEAIVLNNYDKTEYSEEIQIEATPAYNITEGHCQFHTKGRDNGYILTLDGTRIYIAGDTEDIEEMSLIKNIDIAFLPCDQPFTMTPVQVAKVAKIINPKVLFPYHYGETDLQELVDLLSQSNIEIRIRDFR